MPAQKRFWILHAGALGDWILTWPALRCLRRLLPDHRFVGIGRPDILKLGLRFGFLDDVVDGESRALIGLWSGEALPPGLDPPDGAVLWIVDPGAAVRLIEPHAALPVVTVDPFPPDFRTHAARHYCETIRRSLPIDIPDDPVEGFPEHVPVSRYTLIHPGSGGLSKCFKPDFYLRVSGCLQERGFDKTAFLLGPAEIERGWRGTFEDETVIVPDSAYGLADWLCNAALYVGNDSGVSHLAAFMGIPSLVLYRTTEPDVWGALGKRVRWIRAKNEASAEIQIAEAVEAGIADFRG